MKPECAATILHVSDVEASAKYYIEKLGFTIEFKYNDMIGLEYGPVLVYLSGPKQDVKKASGQGSIYIFCDEVDNYYKDVSKKGAHIIVSLEARDYDMRDFAVADPDGNLLTFGKSTNDANA
jgi:uncharacterized glyoxalase superfamily protein PhnB